MGGNQRGNMKVLFSRVITEFLAMMLFVYIGCTTAAVTANGDSKAFKVALTFGFAIASLAYTFGFHGGAQINCAVTFGLMAAGELGPVQGICNFFAQLCGSLVGAALVLATVNENADTTGNLGSNTLGTSTGLTDQNLMGWAHSHKAEQALLGEIMMTFVLMYLVMETAVSKPSAGDRRILAPLACGLAVFLAHCVLIPIDGCSINPTRSFGPAVVASMANRSTYKHWQVWDDHWVFWLGPIIGAFLAVGVNMVMQGLNKKDEDAEAADADAGKAEGIEMADAGKADV